MDYTMLMEFWGVSHYTFTADVAAVAISIMNWLLITTTYTKKQQNLKLFHLANGMVLASALLSMLFHYSIKYLLTTDAFYSYLLHTFMYLFLGTVFIFYYLYIKNLIFMKDKHKKFFYAAIIIPYLFFVIIKFTAPLTGYGFYHYYSEIYNSPINRIVGEPFVFLYLYDSIGMIVLLYLYRKKFVTKMLQCIAEATGLAWLIMTIQLFFGQHSYTCLTFIFPIQAVLFLYHYSSYDVDTGTLDFQAFDSYLSDMSYRKLTFITLTLDKLEKQVMTDTLSSHFYHFNEKYFAGSVIFRVKSDVFLLVLQDEKNPDCQKRIEEMLQDFRELYNLFVLDFKIVILHSDERIADAKTYIRLDDYLKSLMEFNTVRYCKEEDLNKFLKNLDIINHLKDIKASKDLDDDRVQVFCQPILDTHTKKYATAEALMRIQLPKEGMIYPDTFIPILENYELIHDFTLIILNKTCREISKVLEEGYQIDRVTINISMQELKNKYLCNEIIDIIEKHRIPYNKIGIELTESLNELDYENTKFAINQWKKYGMKIYLDDFGTGYSNISRILQLPFDVIKFDRSLTMESGGSDQSYFIVDNFAKIFKRARYHVLFEGVENITDEERCIKMGADMLQGYSYSKPIPIEKIRSFLEKE